MATALQDVDDNTRGNTVRDSTRDQTSLHPFVLNTTNRILQTSGNLLAMATNPVDHDTTDVNARPKTNQAN